MEDDGQRYICLKPFNWLEVNTFFDVFLCCSGWMEKSIGNVILDGIEDIWNSQAAKEVRESVLDETFRFCSSEFCPHLANKSFPVVKASQSEIQGYLDRLSMPKRPSNLNFSYDDSCNLACPSCRETTKMTKDEDKLRVLDKVSEDLISSFGDSVEKIFITGSGDPFASRHFWGLLRSEKLLRCGNSSIRLHTNGMLLNEKRWSDISHINHKIEEIEISIDAASPKTYSINRVGGNWSKLLDNLCFISQLRKENEISNLQLDFVVQANNWHEMEEFVYFARSYSADSIYFTALNYWGAGSYNEYLTKAVHKPTHPKFQDFKTMFDKNIFNDSDVIIGFRDQIDIENESRIACVEIR